MTALLQQLRDTFDLASVTLLERAPGTATAPDRRHDPSSWRIVAQVGGRPCTCPGQGDADIPAGDELALVLRGRTLGAAGRRIAEAFAAQTAAALRQQRLTEEADQVRPLAEADRMRTALLNAVGHDLRSPLASARAAVESLRSPDVAWEDDEREEFLGRLVENLLDMSRLQAGVLGVSTHRLAVEDVVPLAVADVGAPDRVTMRFPDDLPEVVADSVLLERILVNVIGNALRYSPAERPVLVTAGARDGRIELRVIDQGPGIPANERDRVFLPFQRLGDRDNRTGVELGLALSRGLAEAMGGSLVPDQTPGGGLTMFLALPAAAGHASQGAR